MNGYELTSKMRKTRRRYPLTATEQALYNELVAICNEDQWEDMFSCSNYELCKALSISENTLDKARLRLIQVGLISYKSGKSKRQFGSYSFITNSTTSNFEGNVETNAETNKGVNAEVDKGVNIQPTTSNFEDYSKLKQTKEKHLDGHSPNAKQVSKKKFIKPEFEEVKNYFLDTIGNAKNSNAWPPDKCHNQALQFFDHYTANGWVQNRNKPIVDWKASIRLWIRNELNGVFGKAPSSADSKPNQAKELKQKPQLSKMQIDLNYLYERFIENETHVTIISTDVAQYDYLKQEGMISFNQSETEDIRKMAMEKADGDEKLVLRMMKKFGVIEFFKQQKSKCETTIFRLDRRES